MNDMITDYNGTWWYDTITDYNGTWWYDTITDYDGTFEQARKYFISYPGKLTNPVQSNHKTWGNWE